MRLKQYINEVKSYTFEGITNFLRLDCKPFLKEMRGATRLVYRGVDRNIPDIQKMKSHMDSGRRPKDMPEDLHNDLNDLFHNEFGWYVRDGVSTSGSIKTAKHYGVPYIFFPIGKYRYVWSSHIGDLYTEIEDAGYHLDFDEDAVYNEWEWDYSEDSGNGWYEYDGDGQYEDEDDIIDELEEDGEEFDPKLMKWVPEISEDEYIKQREQEWEASREYVMKDAIDSYTNKYLNEKGIRSKNEIMFDCKTYYLIHTRWEKHLIDWLVNYK